MLDDLLTTACHLGNYQIVQMLVEHGANVNYRNEYGETPLHKACEMGNLAVVKFLVSNGANIHAKDRNNTSLVSAAAVSQNIETMSFLESNGCSSSVYDRIITGQLTESEIATHQSIDWNYIHKGGEFKGESLLNIACFHGKVSIAKLLVHNGADINYRQVGKGESALHKIITGCLKEDFQDIEIEKDHQSSLLKRNHILKYLIQNKAELNAKDLSTGTKV